MKWYIVPVVLAALFAPVTAAVTAAAEEDHGYIVKLKPTATITTDLEDEYKLDQLAFSPQYCRVESLEEVETYIGMENVEYIEPRRPLTLFDMPDDTLYEEQWGYTKIKAEYARLAEIDGDGIRMAVIDSGLNKTHEDFEGASIHKGENFARVSMADDTVVSDDLTDYIGHGTAVTSVILSQPDNGKGLCGVAPGVTLVPMRIFSLTEGYDDWAAEAVYAAVDDYDCDVINMSFGLQNPSSVFTAAIKYAAEAGVILVASAGNSGAETLFYPASFDEVISVASIDSDEDRSYFSEYNEKVFVTAPGSNISLANYLGAYFSDSGTSFSSPAVAAAAALALQAEPDLTPEDFCKLLQETSVDLGDAGRDVHFGYGLIDIERLLKELGVTLMEVCAEESGNETDVVGYIEGYEPEERLQMVVAGYNNAGRMISASLAEVRADKIGILEVQEILEQAVMQFEKVKLFLMEPEGAMIPADKFREVMIP